jgi:UDP-N-acetylmuramate--alanine ligase
MNSFGVHNVYNALAAIAAAHVSGVPVNDIVEGLENFKGAKRRMEYKGEINGAQVFDDYGHHPTEVGATLAGAKNACCGRLICVFQPHTYSRT